ncbi:PKD domain-containing protein [Paracrocinitomix mangrovi]|uniref:PKD domain-containing protein n=1 Tax=Paracrocinitomix mangrovi TaxID=2862509 RepID=UPI001C8D3BFF|nr:PKD domain-containing protein [Paracrocinitomix mangrovi]UKN03205.1 PKD domain-containing protein [Paracrocinitomix mangrovi]
MKKKYIYNFLLFLVFSISTNVNAQCIPCDLGTTSFTVDLSSNPDTTWTVSSARNGYCCGASGADACIKFEVITHPNANQLVFDVQSPAPPGGTTYQINCGTPILLGATECINGMNSFCISFCKTGGDSPTYSITTSEAVSASPDVSLNLNCSKDISISGLTESSINWTSISPGLPGDFDSYLNCTNACDTVTITPQVGFPDSVVYVASGIPSACTVGVGSDTVVVYLNDSITASIIPDPSYTCQGGSTNIVVNASGGAPPYNFLWSTTATSSTINVSAGTYSIIVTDSTGCPGGLDTIQVTDVPAFVVDAGVDQTICEGADVNLSGSVSGGTSTGVWSSSGTGAFSPSASDLNAVYTPSAADITAGTVTLTLTSSNTFGCTDVTDQMIVTIELLPVVDAGPDQSVCVGTPANLVGSITGGTTTGYWSSAGTGFFTPDSSDLTGTYSPGTADFLAGTVTLTLTSTNGCQTVSEDMIITIIPAPTVNAGPDQLVCVDNATTSLSGSVTDGGSTGIWSTSGSGTFSPSDTDLNADYIPSNADTTAGSVTLTLTSTNGCIIMNDQMVITYVPAPNANAGSDFSSCANNVVQLNGSVLGGSGTGVWTTSGSGTFSPNDSTLNAIYTPTSADTTAGTLTFTLTSTFNNGCTADADDVVLTFSPIPYVLAGNDTSICATDGSILLSGSVTGGSTTGIWSTSGDGMFLPSNTNLNATYNLGTNDLNNGTVILTLTSTANGSCFPEFDQKTVTITPAAFANAGTDQIVCQSNPDVVLSGNVTGGSSTGIWSSSGSGTFLPSNTDLNATYTPSAADVTAGNVFLILTSTNNGSCQADIDSMSVLITTEPIVNAGVDTTICANLEVPLNGSVIGFTTSGIWSSSGSGSFSPTSTNLSANYLPSAADTANGSVILTLSSTNNGNCPVVTDNLLVSFTPAPQVSAGVVQNICANNGVVNLNGTISAGASQGIWSTFGSGSFSPSDTDLNTTYTLSGADTLLSSIVILLTSTDNGTCNSEQDTLIINLTPSPTSNAGLDTTICIGETLPLDGIVGGGSSTGQWTSSGTGNFNPNNTDLNAIYTPSAADETAGFVTLYLTTTANGNCNAVVDSILLSITSQPTVNAGLDFSICSSDSANLSGVISGSTTTGIWTSSGDGIFIPNNTDLNALYVPGSNDIVNGTVSLDLSATGSCSNSDQIIITIDPGPVVDAGIDQILCLTDNQVNLSGNVSGVTTTGVWSTSGTGNFTPNNTDLNAVYNISVQDSTNGQFFLYLTSTGNGGCSPDIDTIMITLTDIPVVTAGSDLSYCANNPVPLGGNVTGGAGTGIWSTSGSGQFFGSNTQLNAIYVPSAADTIAGSVTLTLTSTNACVTVSDDAVVSFSVGPIVDAGSDTTICDQLTLQLNGSISGATSTGVWSTSGDGIFSPSVNDLNAIYTPGPNDIVSGVFNLTLTPTNVGSCLPFGEVITINLETTPQADAGGNKIICAGNAVSLNGIITGNVDGDWTSLGTGIFVDTNLVTTYVASSADITAGNVDLILTSDTGPCGGDADTITVFFTPNPNVNAGADVVVCANNDSINLVGTVTSGAGIWTTAGDGLFLPDTNDLNAIYIPGNTDETNGNVELYLNAANMQSCPFIEDTLLITITPAPSVNAGPDLNICLSDNFFSLSGTVSGGGSGGFWTTNGTGTFIPDNLSPSTNYQPSIADTSGGQLLFILTSSNNGSCLAESDSINVYFLDLPTVDAGNDATACAGGLVLLFGNVSTGGISWTTNGAGTIGSSTGNPTSYSPALSDTLGPIYVYLNLTTSCGVSTDSLLVSVLPNIDLSVDYNFYCDQSLLTFNATSTGSAIDQIYWDLGDGTFDSTNATTVFNNYLPDSTYTLTVDVVNSDGCTDQSVFDIVLDPLPVADFTVDNTSPFMDSVVTFTDSSLNADSWDWDFGDMTGTYNGQDTIYTYPDPGSYTVILTVSDTSGCTDTAQMIIEVIDPNANSNEPAIPNAFTPNNDGHNDVLYVRGGPFDQFELRIYNEWGNELFRTTDPSDGWDGYYKGQLQPVGVYIYVFEGVTTDGFEYSVTGDFSIIK